MPQEIYNEGRVVGLSAWEIFKRQALGNNVPESEIPNERQWISSMIGMGSSMILRIPSGTQKGILDVQLPSSSNLSAAGVIIANPFIGSCEWDISNWATKVKSYGPLFLNDKDHVPTSESIEGSTDYTKYTSILSNFVKISDGIVYTKNAKWSLSENQLDKFTGSSQQTIFNLSRLAISISSVTIDDIEVPSDQYTLDTSSDPNTITFNTAPGDSTNIVVVYSAHSEPEKDINPNFNNSYPVIRLYITQNITSDLSILFTGFTNKRILQTVSGWAADEGDHSVGGSTDVERNDWANGGMLGPEIIPWSTKIVFSVPSFAYSLLNSLKRTVPSDAAYTIPEGGLDFDRITIKPSAIDSEVRSNCILDMNSINLTDYYNTHEFANDPTLSEDILRADPGSADAYTQLLAWYPGMSAAQINKEVAKDPRSNKNFFPPALYGAVINKNEKSTLVPLDTAAPGTVKMFKDAVQAYNYTQLMPDNTAIYYDGNSYYFVVPGQSEPSNWIKLVDFKYLENEPPRVLLSNGSTSAILVSLTDSTGRRYNINPSGYFKVGPSGKLTWSNLLYSLSNETGIDVLGHGLSNIGTEYEASNSIGTSSTAHITEVESEKLLLGNSSVTGDVPLEASRTVSGGSTLMQLADNQSIKVGTNFIEFGNGLRLYISNANPGTTNVPDGSIGIGWSAPATNDEQEIIEDPGEPEQSDSHPALGG